MADFTHTVSWIVNVDGRSTTYSFEYVLEDVINISRSSLESGAPEGFAITSGPSMVAVVNKDDILYMNVILSEIAGHTAATVAHVNEGEMFVCHLSDSGGVWQEASVNNDNTLEDLEEITVGSPAGNGHTNLELIVLHQAAS